MNVSGRLLAVSLATTVFASNLGAQSNWVDWTDESDLRFLGDPALSTADDQEKDLLAVDLDLDGDDDLLVVRKVPFSTPGGLRNVLFMNEGGVLVDRTEALIPTWLEADDTRDVQAFDADGDGWPDIVTASTFGEDPGLWINLGASVTGQLLGFEKQANWFSPPFPEDPKFCAVSFGDVDNDGDDDLFFSDYDSPLEDRLLINGGDGTFTDETSTRLSPLAANSPFGTSSFILDFNLDGWNDILKVPGLFPSVRLLINDGAGGFFQVQSFTQPAAYMIDVADYNNDGRWDFYNVDDAQDSILINESTQPDGTIVVTEYQVTMSTKTRFFGGNTHSADLDHDGFADAGVADVDTDAPGCNRRFAALRNKLGSQGVEGLFDPNNTLNLEWNYQGVHDFAYLDINSDGFKDMVLGTCAGLRLVTMEPFQSPGTPYCSAALNSARRGALIRAHGSESVSANAFRLVVEGAIEGSVGMFFYGASPQQRTLGDGIRCVGQPTYRLGPAQPIGLTDGLSSRHLDFTRPPADAGGGRIVGGSTWYFQFWYRDSAGAAGSNTSNGLEVVFLP